MKLLIEAIEFTLGEIEPLASGVELEVKFSH